MRELLRSDYLDGEISRNEQQYIEEHLAQCLECRRLEKELQAQRMLFQKAKRQRAPERVWQSIRDVIIEERINQESSVNRGVLRRLRDLILTPKPLFVLASAVTAIIFVAIFTGTIIQKTQSFNKENGGESFADYRLNGESEDLLYGLGTNIEEYFL
jgi:predicted anti-sigma-YlaC factor YlaD